MTVAHFDDFPQRYRAWRDHRAALSLAEEASDRGGRTDPPAAADWESSDAEAAELLQEAAERLGIR